MADSIHLGQSVIDQPASQPAGRARPNLGTGQDRNRIASRDLAGRVARVKLVSYHRFEPFERGRYF